MKLFAPKPDKIFLMYNTGTKRYTVAMEIDAIDGIHRTEDEATVVMHGWSLRLEGWTDDQVNTLFDMWIARHK